MELDLRTLVELAGLGVSLVGPLLFFIISSAIKTAKLQVQVDVLRKNLNDLGRLFRQITKENSHE